jgi:hypothetical protein
MAARLQRLPLLCSQAGAQAIEPGRLLMEPLFAFFYQRLPLRPSSTDEHLHLLNAAERHRLRRTERLVMSLAALLSVLGFLVYYLPIYRHPQLFPALNLSLFGVPFRLAWGEMLWCLLLTSIELFLLVLLNLASVHNIAAATGFITPTTKPERRAFVLQMGLERKSIEASRYGIDPFEGLSKNWLLLFNFVLKLKGWLGNQLIRYLTRLLLGRYAVRTLLDFIGLPLYMAINAYAVYVVMREARVVVMGQTVIRLLLERLPPLALTADEKELVYDTLQYLAVSKRDFHPNHCLLTRELLAHFHIPGKLRHPLPSDYLAKLQRAPAAVGALCRLVIVLGFLLDGQFSWRERGKLRQLNELGILQTNAAELQYYTRDFLNGVGVESWSTGYLAQLDNQTEYLLLHSG